MSSSDSAAGQIIEQYDADISSWENQLHAFEESVKGLSLDDPADQEELAATAHEHLPAIADLYQEVQQTQHDVETLERQIDTVLENPKYRYDHIPESLNKQEQMKDTIEELHETFYLTEERQDYISYELEEAADVSIDDHLYRTPLHQYTAQLRSSMYGQRIEDALSHPDNAFVAGMFAAGLGIIPLDYLYNRRDQD